MTRKLGIVAHTRGIRNNNPFNIRISNNSWKGKFRISGDKDFEQFTNIWYGLRAGFLLLRNAYINKGYNTPVEILYRYAPACENLTEKYIDFVCDSSLDRNTVISVNSLSFFTLCERMLLYESSYVLTYENYLFVIRKFNLW